MGRRSFHWYAPARSGPWIERWVRKPPEWARDRLAGSGGANFYRTDYEEFTIRVREDTGVTKLLRCLGYIGFQMVGFWDEMIIETAKLYSGHPFLAECERRLKQLPAGGSKTRTATGNRLLEITLIDGCRLWVCAGQFQSKPIVLKP